nr:unnamed protein product [Digitaria exilis]
MAGLAEAEEQGIPEVGAGQANNLLGDGFLAATHSFLAAGRRQSSGSCCCYLSLLCCRGRARLFGRRAGPSHVCQITSSSTSPDLTPRGCLSLTTRGGSVWTMTICLAVWPAALWEVMVWLPAAHNSAAKPSMAECGSDGDWRLGSKAGGLVGGGGVASDTLQRCDRRTR